MLKPINKPTTLITYYCDCEGKEVLAQVSLVWKRTRYIAKCRKCKCTIRYSTHNYVI